MSKSPGTASGIRASLSDQSGVAFILLMVSMVAVISAAAIVVDVGHLVTARSESRRAAESAALAGAGWLITDQEDAAGARDRAKEYALLNTVRGAPVVLLDEDIDVILDSSKVRVRVNNVRDRGTAVGTFFARVFGVRDVNVRTLAAAWAAPTGEAPPVEGRCLLPLAIPDRWTETEDGPHHYDPQGTNVEGDYEVGELMVVKVSGSETKGPKSCRTESPYVDFDMCADLPDSQNWRCWYREGPKLGGGADVVGERIWPGTNCGPVMEIGDPVFAASASGNMQSLVNGEFQSLVNSDPGLSWNGNCVVDTSGDCVESSTRIRSIPVVNPTTMTGTGADVSTVIVGFTGVFVERVACNYELGDFGGPSGNWNVYLRIINNNLGSAGDGSGSEIGPDEGSNQKILQLIE